MSRGSARVVAATVALVVLVGSTQLIDAAVAHTGVAAPWQVVGAMPEPNFAPGVVNGPDGLVYLFGGSTPAAIR